MIYNYNYPLKEIGFPGNKSKKIYILEMPTGKVPLYWSKELSEELKETFYINSKYAKKYKKIFELIDQEVIYPCRFNRKYIGFLLHKAKVFFLGLLPFRLASVESSYIGGFYTPEKNKIFLLIDNYSTISNKQNTYQLELLTFHELSHYVAGNKPNTYFSKLFKNLYGFYFVLFTSILHLKKECSKDILKYVKKVINYEKSNSGNPKTPVIYLNELIKNVQNHSELSNTAYKDTSKLLLYYLVSILTGNFSGGNFSRAYYLFSRSFLKAYEYLNADLKYASDSLYYQEFLFPSEIPAIASTNPLNITTKKYINML